LKKLEFKSKRKSMKFEKCSICAFSKAKRLCKINNNASICPGCCAKTRASTCEGCVFYSQAEKYSNEDNSNKKNDQFIIPIDPAITEKVDQALEMAEKGKVLIAEGLISALLKTHPHLDIVHYGMGVIQLLKNQFTEAITFFDQAIKINPYFVEAWFNKAAAHQKKLDITEMVKAYKKVIELGDPREHYVTNAKSLLKDFDAHIRQTHNLPLDKVIELNKLFDDSFALMEAEKWEQAISGFQKVIENHPQHTQSYGNMGICYACLGKKHEAILALNKALELDPHYKPAIINLKAVTKLKEGEPLVTKTHGTVEYYKDQAIKGKYR
jgi:tetratricopeptide (TPR) repeat protein